MTAAARADAARERTGLLGMAIFIASWAMLFASLFFAYGALRVRAPVWPPGDLPALPLGLPALATLALAGSSLLLARGRAIAAALLGAAFLALQAVVWRDLWLAGLRPDGGPYASVFFGLTAFHALHVVVGLGALAWLAVRPARLALRLWTLYWHMVGVLWALLFVLVYLV